MTRDDLIQWAVGKGWKMDRFGHLQRSGYRFKLRRISVRFEIKRDAGWFRVQSGYYSNLSINDAGQLSGLER